MGSPFDIAELKWLLCVHVEDRLTLARLARTSTCFRDWALDVLYGSQMQVCSLIRCVPSQVLQAAKTKNVLLHDMVERNQKRIMTYFRRVKNLMILDREEELWVPILRSLALLVPCIFPNLRELILSDFNPLYMTSPSSFLPSSLHTVTIVFKHDEFLAVWFPAMSSRCPDLRCFFFPGIDSREPDPLILSSLLSLRSLQKVSLFDSISPSTFLTLASLPSLENLTLPSIQQRESHEMLPSSSSLPSQSFDSLRMLRLFQINHLDQLPDFPKGSLPSLRRLEVMNCSQWICERMLEHISSVPLEELDVYGVNIDSPDDMDAFFEHLLPFSRSLEKVSIRRARRNSPALQSWPFGQSCGRLLSLPRLKELVIKIGPGFTMSQSDVDRIGNRWKGLTVFQLRLPRRMEEYRAGLSLEGFTGFVAACPRLEIAAVPFSALDVPLDPSGPHNTHLHRLAIGSAPIKDGIGVAKFLQQGFPHIRHFLYSQLHMGPAELNCWTQVEQRLMWIDDF
ncbi:hypothetical protein DL96DRAFT_1611053, partial [Flagelloscypha sp. PMI_526]